MKHHLDKHLERLHATSPAAESAVFQCELCPKKYSRKDRLRAHERTVHNGNNGKEEDERPHACGLCQYRYCQQKH
jgi:uncharacterized Zn-finger protein